MASSPFDKLDAAMDAFDRKKVADKEAADARQLESDKFVAEFSNFRTFVAHPVFEELGNRMRARGHEFKVEMDDADSGTRSKKLSITLHVFPTRVNAQAHGFGARTEHPSFTISGDSHTRKLNLSGVVVFPNGGMQSGPRGECTLNEATADYVRDQVVECIAASFAPRT